MDNDKFNISKKEFNDKLSILLNQIDTSSIENQDEIDNYIIQLSLMEGDSMIYKNNNKIIKNIIDELNGKSDYIMETDDIEVPELNDHNNNIIQLDEKDLDIDDIDVIDINSLVNKKDVLNAEKDTLDEEIEDVKDLVDDNKVYLNESDLNIDDVDVKDSNDNLLDNVYFDDLIDKETIDSILNDIDLEEK